MIERSKKVARSRKCTISCVICQNSVEIIKAVRIKAYHCLIGKHASILGTPYKDYCRSSQEIEDDETIKHLLYHH